MLTDKQKYFYLIAEVCEKLTIEAVTQAVKSGHPAPLGTLTNVRTGRTPNLPVLVDMVTMALPDYEIPTHLLPNA